MSRPRKIESSEYSILSSKPWTRVRSQKMSIFSLFSILLLSFQLENILPKWDSGTSNKLFFVIYSYALHVVPNWDWTCVQELVDQYRNRHSVFRSNDCSTSFNRFFNEEKSFYFLFINVFFRKTKLRRTIGWCQRWKCSFPMFPISTVICCKISDIRSSLDKNLVNSIVSISFNATKFWIRDLYIPRYFLRLKKLRKIL